MTSVESKSKNQKVSRKKPKGVTTTQVPLAFGEMYEISSDRRKFLKGFRDCYWKGALYKSLLAEKKEAMRSKLAAAGFPDYEYGIPYQGVGKWDPAFHYLLEYGGEMMGEVAQLINDTADKNSLEEDSQVRLKNTFDIASAFHAAADCCLAFIDLAELGSLYWSYVTISLDMGEYEMVWQEDRDAFVKDLLKVHL